MNKELNISEASLNGSAEPPYELVKELGLLSFRQPDESDTLGEVHLDCRIKTLHMPQKTPGVRNGKSYDYWIPLNRQPLQRWTPNAGQDVFCILDWGRQQILNQVNSSLVDIYGGANFVAYPRALQQVANAPYDDDYYHDIVAVKYEGLIFLSSFLNSSEAKRRETDVAHQEHVAYATRSFARMMTCVDETTSEYSMSVHKLGEHTVCMSSAQDCFDETTRERVGLCTVIQFFKGSAGETTFKNRKIRNIWLDLQLSDTPRVVVAKRARSFVVHDLIDMKTRDIPEYAGGENAAWKPSVCMAAIDRFLGFVKESLSNAGDLEYYRFVFGPDPGEIRARNVVEANHRSALTSWR